MNKTKLKEINSDGIRTKKINQQKYKIIPCH